MLFLHAPSARSRVEALHLEPRLHVLVPVGQDRYAVLAEASRAARRAVRIKRKIFEDSQAGRDSNELLTEVAAMQIRCPLLGKDDLCILYDVRPITCRLYGVPTAIGGKAHTCGKTGFKQGEKYPTVALDKVQHRLTELSAELARHLGTAYTELATMYVPVSSALITKYSADYLGIGGLPKEKD